MGEFDLVIRDARIATAADVFDADIGVKDGTIAALARGRSTPRAAGSCPVASTAIATSTSR